MDLRGHGLSDAPTDGYELAPLAEDAIAVVEGTGLDGGGAAGVVFAGHGFGAIVAAWRRRPSRPRRGSCRGPRPRRRRLGGRRGDQRHGARRVAARPRRATEVLRSHGAFLADRRDFDPATWDADQERAARATVVESAGGPRRAVTRPHALAGSVARDVRLPAGGGPARRSGARSSRWSSDDQDGVRTRRADAGRSARCGRRAARRSPSPRSPTPATT